MQENGEFSLANGGEITQSRGIYYISRGKAWMRRVQRDCQFLITSWNVLSDWFSVSVADVDMTWLMTSVFINQSQLASTQYVNKKQNHFVSSRCWTLGFCLIVYTSLSSRHSISVFTWNHNLYLISNSANGLVPVGLSGGGQASFHLAHPITSPEQFLLQGPLPQHRAS